MNPIPKRIDTFCYPDKYPSFFNETQTQVSHFSGFLIKFNFQIPHSNCIAEAHNSIFQPNPLYLSSTLWTLSRLGYQDEFFPFLRPIEPALRHRICSTRSKKSYVCTSEKRRKRDKSRGGPADLERFTGNCKFVWPTDEIEKHSIRWPCRTIGSFA